MLQTKISNLLKEIQSGELEWAYYYVTQKAVEWTICGFVNEGIKLLEILWSFGIEHTRNVWLPDEGLQIMWMVAGSQPSQIPFQFKNVEEIENENWRRCFYPDEEFIRKVLASKTPIASTLPLARMSHPSSTILWVSMYLCSTVILCWTTTVAPMRIGYVWK